MIQTVVSMAVHVITLLFPYMVSVRDNRTITIWRMRIPAWVSSTCLWNLCLWNLHLWSFRTELLGRSFWFLCFRLVININRNTRWDKGFTFPGVRQNDFGCRKIAWTLNGAAENISLCRCWDQQVQIDCGGQSADLPLVVVWIGGPDLLGRNWLQSLQLDWQQIHLWNEPLHEVLNRHSAVF